MNYRTTLIGYGAPVCVVLIFSAMIADAFAQAGGRPLILDTQSGIHSGAGGTVLQTAPLNEPGMVPARPAWFAARSSTTRTADNRGFAVYRGTAGGIAGAQGYGIAPGTQSQPGAAGIGSNTRLRSSASHSGSLYGMPASVQPHVQQQPQSQQPRTRPQSSEQPRAQPRAQPTVSIAPISTATDPSTVSRPLESSRKTSARSSDPHTATGSVTSAQ